MKLSVFMPTIRVPLLMDWYNSLAVACNGIDFEVVTCGPFKPPKELLDLDNFKWVEDFGCPTRAAQIAAIECVGDIIYHTVDDVLFFGTEIANEVNRLDLVNEEIIAMRYKEGQNHTGVKLSPCYWYSDSSYNPQVFKGVDPCWGSCIHFLMKRDLFIEFGGFDCSFEYLNHATHDLLYRIQNTKPVKYVLSDKEVCSADWQPETSGDHAPIHNAQTKHDRYLFNGMWQNEMRVGGVELENWKNVPPVWGRRAEAIADIEISKRVVKKTTKRAVKKTTKRKGGK
jgi:hypothetical protein